MSLGEGSRGEGEKTRKLRRGYQGWGEESSTGEELSLRLQEIGVSRRIHPAHTKSKEKERERGKTSHK